MKAVERIEDLNKISFPKLGWEFNIDPTAFKIGSLEIQWYGIIITLGLVLAVLYCIPRMKRFGIDSDRAIDAVIGGVLGGIVGARAYYVIAEWDEYKGNIKEIFNTRGGGLAIYGGIIGALLVGLLICRIRKVKALPMLDVTVLGFLIGQGIGRWGNFFNAEVYGRETENILRMTINGGPGVHPLFLYEGIWNFVGLVLLLALRHRKKIDGQVFCFYIFWYSLGRLFLEGMRQSEYILYLIPNVLGISQVVAVIGIIIGAGGKIYFGLKAKKTLQ